MWQKPEQLSDVLNRNILSRLNEEQYKTKSVSAHALLSPDRFDLLAKYIYVKFKLQNIQSGFGTEIYAAHINAFNGFVENDESGKVGKQTFFDSFDDVIRSLDQKGFAQDSYLPISSEGNILDGAHRLSAALYLGLDVNVVETKLEPQKYNYAFFENRGLGRVYLDAMASEYAKLKDNVYMVLLWPSAEGQEKELGVILEKYGHVVYRKNIFLNANGAVQLVRQAYMSEPWVGTQKDNFIGARNKAQWCFDKKGPVRAILFESTKDLIEMKEEIRDLYGINKHAIHINDTHTETLELCETILNENSISWLNHSKPSESAFLSSLLKEFKDNLKSIRQKLDDNMILGSGLAAFGYGDSKDLDYVNEEKRDFKFDNKVIELDVEKLEWLSVKLGDLLHDPRNHFYFSRLKFLSLENVRDLKKARGRDRDYEDLHKLEQIIDGRQVADSWSTLLMKLLSARFYRLKLRSLAYKLRFILHRCIRLLKK